MILYFSVLFVCLFVSFSSIGKSQRIKRLLFFSIAIFFCFGYMTGSDWRNYETYYSWLGKGGTGGILIEPGYLYLSELFHYLGVPFWPFFISLKLAAFCCLLKFLRKYSSGNQVLSVTFFLFVSGLFLFIDNPMRNLLAICISYYSYHFLEERHLGKFILLVLLAVLFHTSAVLLLLIAPFYPIKMSNLKLLLLFLVFNIFIVLFYEFIVLKLIGAFSFIPIIETKLLLYFVDGSGLENNRLISLGFIVQFIFFLLLLYKRKQIENLPYGMLIFWGAICYIFLYRIASIVSIFYRLQLYMSIFYAVGICYVFSSFVRKSNKKVYAVFLICYLCYSTYALVTSSYKYVPYTNYISYMFSPELSFEYRANYNFVNSPYEGSGKDLN